MSKQYSPPSETLSPTEVSGNLDLPSLENSFLEVLDWPKCHAQGRETSTNPTFLFGVPGEAHLRSRSNKKMPLRRCNPANDRYVLLSLVCRPENASFDAMCTKQQKRLDESPKERQEDSAGLEYLSWEAFSTCTCHRRPEGIERRYRDSSPRDRDAQAFIGSHGESSHSNDLKGGFTCPFHQRTSQSSLSDIQMPSTSNLTAPKTSSISILPGSHTPTGSFGGAKKNAFTWTSLVPNNFGISYRVLRSREENVRVIEVAL